MLSFIIVNYKSELCLEKCIASIQNVDFECEIIISNNDETRISSFSEKPGLKIIENGKNLGFGAACNLASLRASGEYLCFLNPDTEIISNNIKDLLNNFELNQSIGIIGPALISPDKTLEKWSFGEELTLLRLLLNNFFSNKHRLKEKKGAFQTAWVSGAALFITKDLFEKVGRFDERFFMYFEDVDLCKRVRELGLKVIHFPFFKIKHLGGSSFSVKALQKNLYYTSQEYYFLKHFGSTATFMLKILRLFHL